MVINETKTNVPESVLLVHGIWMTGLEMQWFGLRLREAGYAVHTFRYSSLFTRPEATVADLQRCVEGLGAQRVHWVCHSLGGLHAVACLNANPGLPPGRLLCLGSPLNGSKVARQMSHIIWQRPWLGFGAALLCRGIEALPAGRDVGMIAGTKPFGIGGLLADLDEPHDGAVEVAETRIDGLTDHVEVDETHTGMLFSGRVAHLAVGYLSSGEFSR